jgi:hypothetical protein
MVRGMRGSCNGSNVHHHGEHSDTKRKNPLPGTPNVKVVYDISPRTTIKVARGSSLMEGLRLSTLKQDGHSGLCDSGRWSVIPYIHGEDYCIVVYVLQASVELA